jgi:hypothetical protein
MEEILPDMKKIVVGSSTGNVLPILPLGQTPAALQGK